MTSASPASPAFAQPAAPAAAARGSARLQSIDLLRGAIILLMALDHTRDFFMAQAFSPTDLRHTTPALFFTRFITHYCAPNFIFLAGVSARIMGSRMPRTALSRFLLARGLWLVVLEFSVVNFVWSFNFRYQNGLVMQVIWAIGMSMCALSVLVLLPARAVLGFAVALIAGHNLLDPIAPARFGAWAPLWQIIHVQGRAPFGMVVYPLVPWIGVMALGYCAGVLYTGDARARRKLFAWGGAAACGLFVALRLWNGYGDPSPWHPQARALWSVLSFLNVTKYPPSLDYVLLTLGPALLLLVWFERPHGRLAAIITTFGRVPLFAYVVHLALVHALAGVMGLSKGLGTSVLTQLFLFFPERWGFGLPAVYLAWCAVIVLLYPACRWFAAIKRDHKAWWLSFL